MKPSFVSLALVAGGFVAGCLMTYHLVGPKSGYAVNGAPLVPQFQQSSSFPSAASESAPGSSRPRSGGTVSRPGASATKPAPATDELLDALFKNRPIQPLSGGYALNDSICDFLSITAPDRITLDEALHAALQDLQALQLENIHLVESGDKETRFVINSFPEEGKRRKEQLLKQIQETLGSERSALFMRIADRELGNSFLNFGASDAKISISTLGSLERPSYQTHLVVGGEARLFETDAVPDLLKGIITTD
ncbi:hypothetical protein KBB96_05180 [Luteolibacter ambystomatis]|uniref:Uncharacterized protein n=1 Tax=Luteolibacter ambystomatis TaxID=2824561 RepID=A0A975PG44_9BACT|nr:hypothetical protein [Luteolibacter ambystomatis]QUE52285.1 hypothetical protein KBB96_05180 [Luteolibacter ambystomatis]